MKIFFKPFIEFGKQIFPIHIFFILASFVFTSCGNETKDVSGTQDPDISNPIPNIPTPEFNSDSAYLFIEKQVKFGPRVPNTANHISCGNYLKSTLQTYCDTVYTQEFQMRTYLGQNWNLRNFIGVINPEQKERILIMAHWDTRPFADQDSLKPAAPALGANDGGSGVAVILEMARIFSIQKPKIGIDFILFDGEDGGDRNGDPNTWCLGSQFWSKTPHISRYDAKFGILLDMVGGKDAHFARDEVSKSFANEVLIKVWGVGQQLGYGKHFINYDRSGITDDHLYVNRDQGIPSIDIIEYDGNTESKFGHYWHTHKDNMDIIDKNTLKAVGQTLIQVIMNENVRIP